LRRSSREIVDGDRPNRLAVSRTPIPWALRIAISSRSENDKYRPLNRPGSIDGIPPPSRNHRLPAACDAPTATPACSLVSPFAISRQNARWTSRRNDGRPGDFIGERPVNATIHPAGLPINTPTIKALRQPLESAQYVSLSFGQTARAAGIAVSMGAKGCALDNAVCEAFFATLKKELTRRRSWPTRRELETAVFAWIEGCYR
jgi:hypothetical protein